MKSTEFKITETMLRVAALRLRKNSAPRRMSHYRYLYRAWEQRSGNHYQMAAKAKVPTSKGSLKFAFAAIGNVSKGKRTGSLSNKRLQVLIGKGQGIVYPDILRQGSAPQKGGQDRSLGLTMVSLFDIVYN